MSHTHTRNVCCSLLMRLKVKYLLLVLSCLIFYISIILLLCYCLSYAFNNQHGGGSVKIDGKMVYGDIDWHDYAYLLREASQKGLGEHGVPVNISDSDVDGVAKQLATYGYIASLSDRIALNRSVVDLRPSDCRVMKYAAVLPAVSVIITFNNEHLVTLLRTCASVHNRSPKHLVNEIILVDHASTFDELGTQLDEFVEANGSKIKLIRLANHTGLVRARLEGARQAKSEVLIFLDAHCEVNTNWLPPLLDPIMKNYRRVMCPMIDHINRKTFAYRALDSGARGAFDWKFNYKRLPRLSSDFRKPAVPYKTPVMVGNAFAISAKFLWELGGYDEGLDVPGGEQYELSFKIWMCGGEMYDAPCSRVGHIFRRGAKQHPAGSDDHLHRNYKRVAEVWMDEYKDYLYDSNPKMYADMDAGNLTKPLAIRRNLKCKSFDWFIHEIAFDLIKEYPPRDTFTYAWGVVQSQNNTKLCVDSKNHEIGQPLELSHCGHNLTHPSETNLFFDFTWRSEIRLHNTTSCWEIADILDDAPVKLHQCHHRRGDQAWHLNLTMKWIQHANARGKCLEFNQRTLKLIVNDCDNKNKRMLWSFGGMNKTALATL